MAGTGETEPLPGAAGMTKKLAGLWEIHLFLLPTFQPHFPIQFLNSAALGKALKHQGEPKIPNPRWFTDSFPHPSTSF